MSVRAPRTSELLELTVPTEIDEPCRAPTGLAANRHHLATEFRLQLADDLLRLPHPVGGGEVCHDCETAAVFPGLKAGMISWANSAMRRLISGTGTGAASRPKMTQRFA